MLTLMPILLSGVALAVSAKVSKKRKPKPQGKLLLALSLPESQDENNQELKPVSQSKETSLITAISAYLATLDKQYQRFVQIRIDPLLINNARTQQLALLAAGRERVVSEHEKSINRHIAAGIAAVATVGLVHLTALPLIPLVIATGLYLTVPLFKICWHIATKEHRLSVAHLLAIYFVGLWLGGYYTIGAFGMVFLGLAQKMIALCEQTMHDNLSTIFGQQPSNVWIIVDGVETEIQFSQLQIGQVLVLDVGQMIPIDGVIIQGMATIDQHMLTGEAQPAEKGIGDPVLASTVMLGGRIHVQVEKTASETTAAKISEIISRNEGYRQTTEQKAIAIAEKSLLPMLAAGAISLPLIGVNGAIAILGSNFTMNMVALRPLTVLNFFNTASQQGILIKDAEALEQIKQTRLIVFDKTGTLTLETLEVVHIHLYNASNAEDVIKFAAAAEHRQTHPIALAILAEADKYSVDIPPSESAAYSLGYGLHVQVAGHSVRVGSLRFMQGEQIDLPTDIYALQMATQANGHSLVFVATGDLLIGAIELKACVRPEAKQVVSQLQKEGFDLYIMSGDHEIPTRQLAAELGINHYFSGVLPEQKANFVMQLQQQGNKVCFVGDGINDAIALRQADVSISLCGATTVATDTAQIVLMNADLRQLSKLFKLATELDKNIATNMKVAMAFSLLSGGCVFFLHLKYLAVEVLAATQLLTGVGIASDPLLEKNS